MITVDVVTPERLVSTHQTAEVLIPTVSGTLGVRTGHTHLVAPLKPGTVTITGSPDTTVEVSGGIVEVLADHVYLLVDSAVRSVEATTKAIVEATSLAAQHTREIAVLGDRDPTRALMPQGLGISKVGTRRRKPLGGGPKPGSENELSSSE